MTYTLQPLTWLSTGEARFAAVGSAPHELEHLKNYTYFGLTRDNWERVTWLCANKRYKEAFDYLRRFSDKDKIEWEGEVKV